MKKSVTSIVLLAFAVVGAGGCGKKKSAPAQAGTSQEESKLSHDTLHGNFKFARFICENGDAHLMPAGNSDVIIDFKSDTEASFEFVEPATSQTGGSGSNYSGYSGYPTGNGSTYTYSDGTAVNATTLVKNTISLKLTYSGNFTLTSEALEAPRCVDAKTGKDIASVKDVAFSARFAFKDAKFAIENNTLKLTGQFSASLLDCGNGIGPTALEFTK